ncbi:uncharacterized protein LOC135474083 [Liolophura sinensis]|uniref:uncharacterized protein LOC135474083 n=1 Tax=Liolophura sinensis TaxID=3198878 RepID=UPI003158A9BA
MKLFSLSLALVLLHTSWGILRVGEIIPSDWGTNYRYYDYVKDRDNCRFGYRVSPGTQQVINVFNCTYENEDMFFVLKAMTCATSAHVQNTETCDVTPGLSEENNIPVEGDPDCRFVQKGVAPASDNCCKYLHCSDDGLVRLGTRMCPRGQYFSNQTFRCEHMWKDTVDGSIVSLTEAEMCGTRTLTPDRKKNYGGIMQKCLWNWDFNNANTYSVAEPLNCNFRYLCSMYNPSSVSASYTFKCEPDMYWSNSLQTCVSLNELIMEERRECGL